MAYSIEAALKSNLFSEVMVSTEDDEIAFTAQTYGAKVPFRRSASTADDFATTADVLLEVLEAYKVLGQCFDKTCCIYPTAPFVTPIQLIKGFNMLTQEQRYSVFPVAAFSYPVWRGLVQLADGRAKMLWSEYEKTRSQALPKVYHDAGQWYWFNVDTFRVKKSLLSDNTGMLILDGMSVQDIDSEEDWKLAEIKYEHLQSSK